MGITRELHAITAKTHKETKHTKKPKRRSTRRRPLNRRHRTTRGGPPQETRAPYATQDTGHTADAAMNRETEQGTNNETPAGAGAGAVNR